MSTNAKQRGKEIARFIRYYRKYYGKLFIDVSEIMKDKNLWNTELTGKEFNELFEGFILVRISVNGRKRCYFLNDMAQHLDDEEDKEYSYITIPDDTVVFLSKDYGIILTDYTESNKKKIKNMHIWDDIKYCRKVLNISPIAKLYATLRYSAIELLTYCFENI